MTEQLDTENLIYEPPENQRYWVVRAESGRYVQHFKKFGRISIGHLDEVVRGKYTSDELFKLWDQIRTNFAAHYVSEKRSAFRQRSHWSQVENFSIAMNIGDLVLVPGHGSLSVGRVISEAFTSDEPLSIILNEGDPYQHEDKMSFCLHRKVLWGPTVSRSLTNSALRRALGGHQTVFCADDYWREIHHVLYPFFKRDDEIFFSLRINKLTSISNHSIAKIFTVLSEIEAVSRTPVNQLPNESEDLDELVDQLENKNQLNLSVQAHFMSPGEIWGAASAFSGPLIYYLVYSSIFGSSKLGWKGFYDPRKVPKSLGIAAQKAASLILDRAKMTKTDRAIENLQIEENKVDTTNLSDSSKDVTDVVVKPKRASSPRVRKSKITQIK